MPRESDRFREYVDDLENRKWRCTFCKEKFAGSTPRIRAHLAGIPGHGIKACKEVKDAVRAEALETFNGKGSGLDKSTGGTSGKGMEGTVFDASQSVLPSEGASNPNGTQNSNQHGCAPQQQSFYRSTVTGTAPACPQDQVSLPPSDMPLDNLDNTQQSHPLNRKLDAAHGNENASSLRPLSSLNISEPPALPELSTHLEFGTGTALACPQDEVSLPPGDMPLGNLDNTQQSDLLNHRLDASHENEIASPLQQPLMDWSAYTSELLAPPELPTNLEFGGDALPTPLLSNITMTSIPQYSNGLYLSFEEQFADGIAPYPTLYSDWSNLHLFLPENLLESHGVIANAFEEIEMDELHNPTVGSLLQTDPFLDVDRANRLQDCSQPRGVVEVPVPSNTSLTNTVQHPGQLTQRCDKEDGNDTRRFLRTPMDVHPSTASQHTSVVNLLVPEVSTNPIGPSSSHGLVPPQCQGVLHQSINLEIAHQNPTVPSSSWENHLVTCHPQASMHMDSCMPSSSQAPYNAPPPQILPCGTGLIGPSSLPESYMNEGAPMMSHPNTGNDFEDNRDLKRKLDLLYEKEADIRVELEYAASLYLKKLRMGVANWLANVEKLRNDCTEAANEDCLPPHQQVDTLMREAEDLMRLDKGLFEARETKIDKLLEDKMVGEAFWRKTTEILEYLAGNQISRLGIYGMGGVGKTTIMVHIYNRLLEKENYGNVLWITVSQDLNTQRLQDTIGKELGLNMLQEKDVRKRAAMLCICLTKRGKSTIILDDVWESFEPKEVGIPVRVDGIKLVLTTRSFDVCRQMQCQEMIKIEPLSQIEAEGLFLEELTSEVVNLETKAVVKSIVRECAGLPLAIITMARSMRGVTDVLEWKDFLDKLRESDMGQTDMEKVLMKLKLSYDCLGKPEVQQCFLSCALYPEDKLISKSQLIEFFIDQELIGRLNTMEKQYVRGFTILNKLVNVCLLEDHGKRIKMHDLIRDMALHVMSEISIVEAGKGLRRIPYEEYWTKDLEKVSLMENEIREFSLNMSPNCPKLSTLLFNKSLLCNMVIPDSFFKQLWGLKVLDLSSCRLRELPNSISDLIHLTTLLIRLCTNLRRIPYLGKLSSLRKLDLLGCVQLEAIEGLETLVNLTYLDIAFTRVKRLPKGTLEALLQLQYLSVYAVNAEDIKKLEALEALRCQFEDVDDFNNLVRVVSKQRNKPRYFHLVCVEQIPEDMIVIDEAPFQNLERRVYVKTRSHRIVIAGRESSGSGISILIPQHVRTLSMCNCDGLTNLFDIGLLENLEELTIWKCKNLRVLSGRQDEEIIDIHDSPTPTPASLFFLSLRVLSINNCQRLKYLLGHGPKFYLSQLRKIKIDYCKEMVGITAAVTSRSLHPPLAFPTLEDISIWKCDKMKRVVESEWLPHFPNLKKIEVNNCKNMEEIIGGPPPYMPVEEISLEWLLVDHCNNMRRLFPHELLIHLRNLQKINVKFCKGMVEMISGARQDQEGSIMTSVNNTPSSFQSSISLPKLNSLVLHFLPQLKSICEVPITCDSMEYLKVYGCLELNKIPLQLQLRDTENLPHIEVEGEEKWKTLIWDPPNAQAILQSHLHFHWGRCILEGRRNSRPS